MTLKTLRTFALIGATIFIAGGILELAHRQADHFRSAADYGIEAALALGLVGTAAGLYALHLRQEEDLSRAGLWSFRVAVGGQLTLAVVAFATLLRGQDALGPLFPLAVLAWALGTIVYAVATARAARLPRWVAAALPLATVIGIGLNPGGTAVIGVLWIVVATTVLNERLELRTALG